MMELEAVRQTFGDAIEKIESDRVGCPIVWVRHDRNADVLRFLKDSPAFSFEFLSDLTAYDDQDGPEESCGRFVVVYNLFSPNSKKRLRVKTRVADGVPVPTAVGVWEAANWAEREVFDLFGIKFQGHPDLRRILLDIRWEGYPLRKDYHWRKYQLFNDPEPMPEYLLKDDSHASKSE